MGGQLPDALWQVMNMDYSHKLNSKRNSPPPMQMAVLVIYGKTHGHLRNRGCTVKIMATYAIGNVWRIYTYTYVYVYMD